MSTINIREHALVLDRHALRRQAAEDLVDLCSRSVGLEQDNVRTCTRFGKTCEQCALRGSAVFTSGSHFIKVPP